MKFVFYSEVVISNAKMEAEDDDLETLRSVLADVQLLQFFSRIRDDLQVINSHVIELALILNNVLFWLLKFKFKYF